jgi:hypothetical protein
MNISKQYTFKSFFLGLVFTAAILGKETSTQINPFFKYTLETDFGLATGYWIPTNNLSVLGNHPEIGLIIRSSLRPLFWRLNVRGLLNSKSLRNYNVLVNDTVKSTQYIYGISALGINLGTEIYRHKWFCSDFSWSVGVSGFDAIRENKKLNIKGKSLGSFSSGPTVGFRFYINRFILNPEITYNFSFFNNSGTGATDLKGDALSLNVNLSFIGTKGFRNNCHPNRLVSKDSDFHCQICDSINHSFLIAEDSINSNYWKQIFIIKDIFNIPDSIFTPYISNNRLPISCYDSVCFQADRHEWAYHYYYPLPTDAFLELNQNVSYDTSCLSWPLLTYISYRSYFRKIDSLLLSRGFSKRNTDPFGRVVFGYIFNLFVDFENPRFTYTYEKGCISISTYPCDHYLIKDPPHSFKLKPMLFQIRPNLDQNIRNWRNSIDTCANHIKD